MGSRLSRWLRFLRVKKDGVVMLVTGQAALCFSIAVDEHAYKSPRMFRASRVFRVCMYIPGTTIGTIAPYEK